MQPTVIDSLMPLIDRSHSQWSDIVCYSFQCWCWSDWCFHRPWLPIGPGWCRGRGRCLCADQSDAQRPHQHDSDGREYTTDSSLSINTVIAGSLLRVFAATWLGSHELLCVIVYSIKNFLEFLEKFFVCLWHCVNKSSLKCGKEVPMWSKGIVPKFQVE